MTKQWIKDNAAREHRTAANGTELYAVEAGAGPLLILLSGWPQTWYSWHKVMPQLARNYRVVAVDLPGLGASDDPRDGYDTRSIALHLDAVLAKFGSHACTLLTHDIGAWVGYAYAANRPERVRSLTLIDAALPGLAPAAAFQLSPESARKVWHFYFNYLPELPELLITGREREFLQWSFREKSHDWKSTFSEDTIDLYAQAYARPGRWSSAMGYYRHIFESAAQNQETSRSRLALPVLAVGGASALGSAVKSAAETVASNVRSCIIPECGHFVCEEKPNDLLREFLAFDAATRGRD